MALFSFPYTRFSVSPTSPFPEMREVYRPVVVTTISIAGRKATCHAVIDSGADRCLFPALLLNKLGLVKASMPMEVASGIGSSVTSYFADASIEVRGAGSFSMVAGFAPALDDWGLGVLGQIGFFENFRVFFDYSGGYFNLETK